MGRAEDSFGLGPVGEYSGHIDDPRSRRVLFSECDGRRGPYVEIHGLGVGFEPIGQLFKGLKKDSCLVGLPLVPFGRGSIRANLLGI